MNASAEIHLTPAKVKGKYVIRFVANQEHCNENQIEAAWSIIQVFATEVILEILPQRSSRVSHSHLDERHLQRFSFTRKVSNEVFKRQSSLYDF